MSRTRALGVLLLPVLLTGCATAQAAAPARTVTVTATPTPAAVQAGDSAPWDLQALCAAESEAETLRIWRDQQTKAGRLSSAQSDAVLQAIAVVYLEFDGRGLPDALQQDVTRLRDAAGPLEHPRIDLETKTVRSARNHLHEACRDDGLQIGVIAQGG
ncbi:hypothetical protein GCM10025783_18490 [Amnibacterium soli]|uniref:Lipoprotein n=1 Tax=Amnibacterium soli TaxID=1282736 RepID=A0ABP8Z513_9MICO